MNRSLLLLGFLGSVVACSSSSGSAPAGPSDASQEASAADASGVDAHGDAGAEAASPTTTIAAARAAYAGDGGASAPITVVGFVTAVEGTTGDQPVYYIEDPAGGAQSGIAIFCDPLGTSCPCASTCSGALSTPPLHSLVTLTGPISAYHGQLQIEPTAVSVTQMNASAPPVYMATAADVAEKADSPYRGVYVKLASSVTVDDLTPAALYDTQCDVSDGGKKGADAGKPLCTGCAPPSYSGFQAHDGQGNELFVEQTFFNSDPLQSSPECVSQPGAVAVTQGEQFPFVAGILDVDPYSGDQAISPVLPSDYGQ